MLQESFLARMLVSKLVRLLMRNFVRNLCESMAPTHRNCGADFLTRNLTGSP